MNLVQLEAYFKSVDLPKGIRLNDWIYINDVALFIDTYVATLKANSGKRLFIPYFRRLNELKKRIDETIH